MNCEHTNTRIVQSCADKLWRILVRLFGDVVTNVVDVVDTR